MCYEGGGSKGEYRKKTTPVNSFSPNPWGLYNVHGNVSEWTQDCWSWNAGNKGNPGDGSARTSETRISASMDCGRRVLRGGSWIHTPSFLRAAKRDRNDSTFRSDSVGFRIARTL
jgi:formylglycine-generating enzyme required for sulfatase activity